MAMAANGTIRLLKGSLFILVIAIILMSMTPSGSASESTEYTTIVLTKDVAYEIGDNATIEVHFYHLSEPRDAADLNITLEDPAEGVRYVDVNITGSRVEEGVYLIIFEITEEDTLHWMNYLDGTVRCSMADNRGGKNDSANFRLYTATEEVQVLVTSDRPQFSAGETIRFTVEMTADGIPFDVPDFRDEAARRRGRRRDARAPHRGDRNLS